jgi:hypothetical protein
MVVTAYLARYGNRNARKEKQTDNILVNKEYVISEQKADCPIANGL